MLAAFEARKRVWEGNRDLSTPQIVSLCESVCSAQDDISNQDDFSAQDDSSMCISAQDDPSQDDPRNKPVVATGCRWAR